ncbi:hypothetical protein [Halanaeroarchaeum sulfurireducens]|uniref:hypothetical protein n=1 Tax=Halanaeroarchaeum sulfurireducens TaxID=1604004 RepID=UPI000678C7CC|nr:hypothetical protein [Halanaeroarchaeum sulfurireducens]
MNSLDQSRKLDGFEVGSGILAILAGIFLALAFIAPRAQADSIWVNAMPIWAPILAALIGVIYALFSN